MNNFDVLKEMAKRGMNIQLAPLDNITNLRQVKAGTQVTIGVAGNVVAALGLERKFVGGMLLADREQFDQLKSEMSKRPTFRSREDIEKEVARLNPICKDYDTETETNNTCLAVGAHDALRWVLGLAEDPISEVITRT